MTVYFVKVKKNSFMIYLLILFIQFLLYLFIEIFLWNDWIIYLSPFFAKPP